MILIFIVIGLNDIAYLHCPMWRAGKDHTLVHQFMERLHKRDQAIVVKNFRPETGIQEVHNRVLRAADIKIDRQPVCSQSLIERSVI